MNMSEFIEQQTSFKAIGRTLSDYAETIKSAEKALARSAAFEFDRNSAASLKATSQIAKIFSDSHSAKAIMEKNSALNSVIESAAKFDLNRSFALPPPPPPQISNFVPRQLPLMTVVGRHTEILEDSLKVAQRQLEEMQSANRAAEARARRAEEKAEESERQRLCEQEAAFTEARQLSKKSDALTFVCCALGAVLSYVLAAVSIYFSIK